MSPTGNLRTAILLAAWAALLAFGWLSWQVYASHRAAADYAGPWTIGPGADDLNQAAELRLGAALDSLRDRDRPIGERLNAYRAQLRAADRLLVQSLRARPPQAQSLSRLAATRWEIDRPGGEPGVTRHLALIDVASTMAPSVPRVQFELGKLLLHMGRGDDAARVFARTLELDPGRSADVVEALRLRGLSGTEILKRVPPRAELLVALAPVFAAEGDVDAYRDLLERELDPDRADSLAVFGEACLTTDHAGLLVQRLLGAGPRERRDAEAERLKQLSLGYLDLSRPSEALAAAGSARALFPHSGAMAEHVGDVARGAGDSETAREAYRDALSQWAREPGKPSRRARLYLKIGRTYETDGRADLAYDAFKMALRLNRDEGYARRRIAEMEAAAGLPSGASAAEGG